MTGFDRQTPAGKKFMKELAELAKNEVRVGFQRGESEVDGVDIVDIAMWNELGASNSPARPFIRQSTDTNKSNIEKFCKAQLQKIADGGTAEQVLTSIGVMQKALIQDAITNSKSWATENAESTINAKGSDVPLIDSGRMLQSVNFVVDKKGSGD